MRGRNWISGGLALILIFSLAGCSLAQPEKEGPEQDEFIGYYLIYGSEGEVYENLVDEHWRRGSTSFPTWTGCLSSFPSSPTGIMERRTGIIPSACSGASWT